MPPQGGPTTGSTQNSTGATTVPQLPGTTNAALNQANVYENSLFGGAGGSNLGSTTLPSGLATGAAGTGLPEPASQGGSAGGEPLQPGAAVSPYTFSTEAAKTNVILGQFMAQMLGSTTAPDTAITIGQAVADFHELSFNQQQAVEDQLWNAGFYVDSAGDPLQTRPNMGSEDPANVNALSFALVSAANANPTMDPKGQTASGLVAALVASGAGARMRQLPPSPVSGGGNYYQNLVTNPDDLYSQLYSTFESTLGRAPNQDEVTGFQGLYQKQQQQFQQVLINQQEQSSLARFHQSEYARNTEMAFARTPAAAGATNGVPTGPFHSPAAWATAFLAYGGFKITSSNISFLLSVINKLGGWGAATKSFNPLGSALPGGGPAQVTGAWVPSQNAAQNYQSWAQGMMMTLDALSNYPFIVMTLKDGDAANAPAATQSRLLSELTKWSNGTIKALPEASAGDRKQADNAVAAVTPAGPGRFNTSTVAPSGGTAQAAEAQAAAAPGIGQFFANYGTQPTGLGVTGPGNAPTGAPPADQGTGVNAGPGVGQFFANYGQQPTGLGTNKAPASAGAAGAPAQPAWKGATTPAASVPPGQNQYSAGDTYIAPTEVSGAGLPTPAAAAFTAATTGANAIPYQGNEFLNAMGVIAQMIANGGRPVGGAGGTQG
jgi:hypothetical protein